MRDSFTAQLICGFKLEIRNKEVERRKFNEDTGEPYSIKAFSHEIALVDGVEIGTSEKNSDAFCNGESIENLQIGEIGYLSGIKWIGIPVVTVNSHNVFYKEIDFSIPEVVQKFSDKYGISPHWFLALDI